MDMNMDLLKKLCLANGVSSGEDEVRNIIISEIDGYADEIAVDKSGNIIVFKKGAAPAKNKLVLSAHMDEVGFIVTCVNGDGTLSADEGSNLIQAVTITNTYVDIKVKKVDDSDKAVKGAVLAVKDSNGTIIDKWTTNGSIHEVQGLVPDATYTLTELSAPEGYEKSADIKFTTGPDGRVQVLKMVDKKTVVPNTSDTNHTAGWTASLITSMLVALAAFFMKKRYNYR